MSLVEEIVNLHNGEVLVDSVHGQGTKVTLSIPAARAPEQALQ
jgi:signal transduction histidine kinase